MSDDDDYPYDHEDDEAPVSCRPDTEMTPLDQLQRYQFVLRKICPLLDSFESNVLMQIVDRTAGWKKHAAYFPVSTLYEGDVTVYGGLKRQMHISRLKKALQTLERRGVINRIAQPYYSTKIFRVNYDVDLEHLRASAPEERRQEPVSQRDARVSHEDPPVHEAHYPVSSGDEEVSHRDPIEVYSENNIRDNNNITRRRLLPSEPIVARSPVVSEDGGRTNDASTAEPQPPEINPRRRTRPSAL